MAKKPRGSAQQYRSWKMGAQVGCLFARAFAVRGEPTFGQCSKVIKASTTKVVAKQIDLVVSQWIADPAAMAATILLPKVAKLEAVARIALELESLPHWRVERWRIDKNVVGPDVVAFRVTRSLTIQGGVSVPSEVLVLGPFDPFPPTRLAPVTALEMYVGTPAATDFEGNPRTKANIADVVTIPPLADSAVAQMWPGSRKLRKEQLEHPDDQRAKAKVSFVVPAQMATALGCLP